MYQESRKTYNLQHFKTSQFYKGTLNIRLSENRSIHFTASLNQDNFEDLDFLTNFARRGWFPSSQTQPRLCKDRTYLPHFTSLFLLPKNFVFNKEPRRFVDHFN
ncbi:hypothetical protein SCA6_018549 [Theobroma cacao]